MRVESAQPRFADLIEQRRRSLLRTRLLTSVAFAAVIVVPAALMAAVLAGPRVGLLTALLAAPGLALAIVEVLRQTRMRIDRLTRALQTSEPRLEAPPAGWELPEDLTESEEALVALARGAQRATALSEQEARAAREHSRVTSEGVAALFQRRVQAEEATIIALAAELHDTVAQSLLAAQWTLEQDGDSAEAAELIRTAERQLRDVLALARLPDVEVDVATGVTAMIDQFERRFGLVTTVSAWPSEQFEVPVQTAASVYRFFQEALRNVIKHSGQARADLSLIVRDDGYLQAQVRDDGAGFLTDAVHPIDGRHVGLLSMDDRARACGGSMGVESAPGEGTTLTLVVPLQESLAA